MLKNTQLASESIALKNVEILMLEQATWEWKRPGVVVLHLIWWHESPGGEILLVCVVWPWVWRGKHRPSPPPSSLTSWKQTARTSVVNSTYFQPQRGGLKTVTVMSVAVFNRLTELFLMFRSTTCDQLKGIITNRVWQTDMFIVSVLHPIILY